MSLICPREAYDFAPCVPRRGIPPATSSGLSARVGPSRTRSTGPDGRQVQKRVGPAWTERGRPREGWFTKRTAEAWLQDVLHDARRGTLPGMVRTGATFADAAAEWLRFVEEDRERKPSTLVGYRSALKAHLLPAFGEMKLEDIGPDEVERWRRSLTGMSNRSKNKLLIQLHGIFRRAQTVWHLPTNPLVRVEKHPIRASGDVQVFSPEEVWALVRAAASDQDGAIYLTAAFMGLRMGELLALRWRDVDFAGSTIRVRTSWAGGDLTTPKSGKVRAVPMAPTSPPRSPRSAAGISSPTSTTGCSSARPAPTWTGGIL